MDIYVASELCMKTLYMAPLEKEILLRKISEVPSITSWYTYTCFHCGKHQIRLISYLSFCADQRVSCIMKSINNNSVTNDKSQPNHLLQQL